MHLVWDAAEPATECTDCATQEPVPCNVPVDGYRIFYGADQENLTSYFDAGDSLEITLNLPQNVFVGAKSYRNDLDCDGNPLPEKLSDYSNIIYYAGLGDLLPATNLQAVQDCQTGEPMSAAFINTCEGNWASGSSFASTALNVTSGNFIAVVTAMARFDGACPTITSITDTAGNTYTLANSGSYETDHYRLYIHYAQNVTGHANNVVTVNLSGSTLAVANSRQLQFSGLATSSVHDTGYAPPLNTDTASPYITTADDTAQDNEIIIGAFGVLEGVDRTYSSSAPSVKITDLLSGSEWGAIATNTIATQGSASVAVAASGTNSEHICLAAAFKIAAEPAAFQAAWARGSNVILQAGR